MTFMRIVLFILAVVLAGCASRKCDGIMETSHGEYEVGATCEVHTW